MQLEDYFHFLSADDIRLKGHRIGIDHILNYFIDGYTPEEIQRIYPEVSLEKIYASITYYLHNRAKMDAYLTRLQKWQESRYQEAISKLSPIAQRMRTIKAQRVATGFH